MISVWCLHWHNLSYDSAEYISQDKEGRNGYPEIKVQAAFAGITKYMLIFAFRKISALYG